MKISLAAGVLLLASCTSNYYTKDDFPQVPKVDAHIHINTESAALTNLAKDDNFFLVTINVESNSGSTIDDQERFARVQAANSPKQIAYLSTFSMKGWGSQQWNDSAVSRLNDSFKNGALGIKVWKNIGIVERDSTGKFITIDDPSFEKIIRTVIDNDKTILAHIGEPKNCWLPLEEMTVNNDRNYFQNNPQYHMHLHPEYPSYDEVIAARDRMHEKYPELRIVGAHLASLEWNLDELAKRLDRFPNLAVDMGARIPHLQYLTQQDREKVRQFFDKYQDRIVYATDLSVRATSDPMEAKANLHEVWLKDWAYFVTDDSLSSPQVNGGFRGLKLEKGIIDKIYRTNAVRWFKIPQ